MAGLADLVVNLTAETSQFSRGLESARQEGQRFARGFGDIGRSGSQGMDAIEGSTQRARQAVMLLGYETGIRLPRALVGVIAQSQILAPILTGAFSVVAIGAFLAAAEKIPDVIAKLKDKWAGVTEETKKAFDAQTSYFASAVSHWASQQSQIMHLSEKGALTPSAGANQGQTNTQKEIELYQKLIPILEQAKTAKNLLASSDKPSNESTYASIERMKNDLNAIGLKDLGVPGSLNVDASAKTFNEQANKFFDQLISGADEAKRHLDDLRKVKLPELALEISKAEAEAKKAFNNEINQFQVAIAKGNDNVIGQIQAQWNERLAKLSENFKLLPTTLQKEFGPAYRTALGQAFKAEQVEIAEADRKIKEQADKAFEEYAKSKQGMPTLVPPVTAMPRPNFASGDLDQIGKLLSQGQWDRLNLQMEQMQTMAGALTSSFDDLFTGIATGSRSASQIFAGFADAIVASIGKIITQMISMWIMQQITGFIFNQGMKGLPAISGSNTNLGNFWGNSIFTGPWKIAPGAHAAGGSFGSNDWMVVGERGPELIAPLGRGGDVIPNNRLGGVTIYQSVDARGADASAIPRILEASRAIARGEAKRAVSNYRESTLRS